MLTMLPPPAAIIDGAHSFERCQTAVTFNSITSRNVSTDLGLDRPQPGHAGVVDEHVDPAAPIDHFRDDPLPLVAVRQVGRDRDCTRQLTCQGSQPLAASGHHHDRGPDGVQHPREAVAQA